MPARPRNALSNKLSMVETYFSHPKEWYKTAYVHMGPGRSIDRLHRNLLADTPDEKHPKCETLRDWCKDEKWLPAARYYDRGREDERKTAHPYNADVNQDETLRNLGFFSAQAVGLATQVVGSKNPEEITVREAALLCEIGMKGLEMHMRLTAVKRTEAELARLEALAEKEEAAENARYAAEEKKELDEMLTTLSKRLEAEERERKAGRLESEQ